MNRIESGARFLVAGALLWSASRDVINPPQVESSPNNRLNCAVQQYDADTGEYSPYEGQVIPFTRSDFAYTIDLETIFNSFKATIKDDPRTLWDVSYNTATFDMLGRPLDYTTEQYTDADLNPETSTLGLVQTEPQIFYSEATCVGIDLPHIGVGVLEFEVQGEKYQLVFFNDQNIVTVATWNGKIPEGVTTEFLTYSPNNRMVFRISDIPLASKITYFEASTMQPYTFYDGIYPSWLSSHEAQDYLANILSVLGYPFPNREVIAQ